MPRNRDSKTNPAGARKRVEADEGADAVHGSTITSMIRAKDGSAFARCDECKKDVPVVLIGMHSCSLDAKIKMNLEAQVAEAETEAKKKPAESGKAISSEPKAKKAKRAKTKNPNLPKRPSTAFFVFMKDFRRAFKEENPGAMDVKRVAKEGGEKWRSMTEEEKKPYVEKAEELKAEYEKTIGEGKIQETENVEEAAAERKEDNLEELYDEDE